MYSGLGMRPFGGRTIAACVHQLKELPAKAGGLALGGLGRRGCVQCCEETGALLAGSRTQHQSDVMQHTNRHLYREANWEEEQIGTDVTHPGRTGNARH